MQEKDIGNQISSARKRLNLTQRELADKLGVSDKTISKWERAGGYPDISMLLPLCNELGIELSQLLGEKEQMCESKNKHLKTFIEYAMMKVKENKQSILRKCWITLIIVSCIAIGICLLCDYILTKDFGWSIITTVSIIYGCIIITPLLLVHHHIIEKTLALIMIFIFPFLYILSLYLPYILFLELAWQLALISDCFIILTYFILIKMKSSIWYKLAMIVFISGIYNLLINDITKSGDQFVLLQLTINVSVSIILFIIGSIQKRKMTHDA